LRAGTKPCELHSPFIIENKVYFARFFDGLAKKYLINSMVFEARRDLFAK
jgi:hypothetical protein